VSSTWSHANLSESVEGHKKPCGTTDETLDGAVDFSIVE